MLEQRNLWKTKGRKEKLNVILMSDKFSFL